MGNRTDNAGVPTTGNRYASFNGASYTYDADGNVTRKYKAGVYDIYFYWNPVNQLDSVVNNGYRTYFEYNALGHPVRVSEGSSYPLTLQRYLLWDGENLLSQLGPAGQRGVDYAYLPGATDHPFAYEHGATTPTDISYFEIDELGNVIGTSQAASLRQDNPYDGWGIHASNLPTDQYLYWKGLFWNGDNAALYYMRNRWYDPDGGRFVNEDPDGFAGGINLYAFAGNDPINANDSFGLDAQSPCEELYMYQVGDAISFGWEDAPCKPPVSDAPNPDEPPEPPIPQIPQDDPHQPPGGGAPRLGGTTKTPVPQIDVAACKAAAISFVVSGSLDAFTLVGGVGILVRGAVAYRAGTSMVTSSLGNPYARQNAAAVVQRGLAELRTLGIGPGGAFPTSAGAGLAGQMLTGSKFNIRDYLPFVATSRAYGAMNRACPS